MSRSKSLKAYQMSEHYTEVYITLRQEPLHHLCQENTDMTYDVQFRKSSIRNLGLLYLISQSSALSDDVALQQNLSQPFPPVHPWTGSVQMKQRPITGYQYCSQTDWLMSWKVACFVLKCQPCSLLYWSSALNILLGFEYSTVIIRPMCCVYCYRGFSSVKTSVPAVIVVLFILAAVKICQWTK